MKIININRYDVGVGAGGGEGGGGGDAALPTLSQGSYLGHWKANSGVYDAVTGGTLADDTDTVGRWEKDSGVTGGGAVDNYVASPTITNGPQYRTGGLGGYPYIKFDAANNERMWSDFYRGGGGTLYTEPWTWLIVGRFVDTPTQGGAMFHLSGGSARKSIVRQWGTSNVYADLVYPLHGASAIDLGVPDTNVHVWELSTRNGGAGTDRASVDGTVSTGTFTRTGGNPTAISSTWLGAGEVWDAHEATDCEIYEIVAIYNPATQDITDNINRLKTKYGL